MFARGCDETMVSPHPFRYLGIASQPLSARNYTGPTFVT